MVVGLSTCNGVALFLSGKFATFPRKGAKLSCREKRNLRRFGN